MGLWNPRLQAIQLPPGFSLNVDLFTEVGGWVGRA